MARRVVQSQCLLHGVKSSMSGDDPPSNPENLCKDPVSPEPYCNRHKRIPVSPIVMCCAAVASTKVSIGFCRGHGLLDAPIYLSVGCVAHLFFSVNNVVCLFAECGVYAFNEFIDRNRLLEAHRDRGTSIQGISCSCYR